MKVGKRTRGIAGAAVLILFAVGVVIWAGKDSSHRDNEIIQAAKDRTKGKPNSAELVCIDHSNCHFIQNGEDTFLGGPLRYDIKSGSPIVLDKVPK